ncbi:MAG: phosphoribosylanthranilate isomerase [Candidatus Eisenbacteria bacterium]
MSVRVKICGITRREDGARALAAGAHALGFVLAERSPRHVTGEEAEALVAALRKEAPQPFLAVAVLDRYDPLAGERAIRDLGFDRVQFHGVDGMPALHACLAVFDEATRHAWGAVRVADQASLEGADDLACEAVVLDTHVAGVAGGTGRAFDWTLAAPLAARRKVVLAGGLTPDTVAEAVRTVRPWMVDVSSGVEAGPGVKDEARMRAFVEAVHGA